MEKTVRMSVTDVNKYVAVVFILYRAGLDLTLLKVHLNTVFSISIAMRLVIKLVRVS